MWRAFGAILLAYASGIVAGATIEWSPSMGAMLGDISWLKYVLMAIAGFMVPFER